LSSAGYRHQMRPPRVESPLRAGIVGAGLMGRWHAATIPKVKGRLVAVADTCLSSAQRLASRYSGAQAFIDIEQLLKHAACEVIHVCTPVSSHQRIAALAIDAGCHVIIEKPLTCERLSTEYLLGRAKQQGVLCCPVHQFAFQDGFLKAQEHLHGIGRLIHLEAIFSSAGGIGQTDEQLDAIVSDILPHPLSLMRALLPHGLPNNWVTVTPGPGELRAMAAMSDLSLSVHISMHARPPECALRILGSEGTIHADLFHGYSFVEPGRVSKSRKVFRPFDLASRRLGAAAVNLGHRVIRNELAYPGLQRLLAQFYEAVRTKRDSPIAPEAVVDIARVRDVLVSRMGASTARRACNES
jgi:predicted dehydrogenase